MAITAADLNKTKCLEILSRNIANVDTPRFNAQDGESRKKSLDKYNFFFEVLTNNEIIRLSELEALNECYILKKPHFDFFTGFAGKAVRQILLSSIVENYILRKLNKDKDFSNINYLEVGSWLGASLLSVSSVVSNYQANGKYTCVDLWKPYNPRADIIGSEKSARMEELCRNESAFPLFLYNATASIKTEDLNVVRQSSMQALRQFKSAERSIYDIAFVDGLHYYEFVLNDLLLSYDLLKSGGVLIFDDYECRFYDIQDWTDIENRDYIPNPKNGIMFHPGVTKAVNKFCEIKGVQENSIYQVCGLGILVKDSNERLKISKYKDNLFIPDHLPLEWLELAQRDLSKEFKNTDKYK